MKKKLSLIFVLMITILAVGCGSSAKPETAVNDAVKGYFKAMKEFDVAKMAQYTDADLESEFSTDDVPEDQRYTIDLIKLILSKTDYEIKKTTVDKDTATVEVTVKSLDYEALATDLQSVEGIDPEDGDAMVKALKDLVDSGDYKADQEEDITLTLNKKSDKWVIAYDADLGSLIAP